MEAGSSPKLLKQAINAITNRTPANLLLISFDQWRGDWGDPHAPLIQLPTLKGLANEGWTARRCYTSSPHCVPARMSWLTGLAPSQLGITKNINTSLPTDAPSIIRELQQQGWHTSLVGKTHWTSHAKAGDLRHDLPRLNALGFDQAIEVCGPRALRRMNCALTDDWAKAGLLATQRADLEKRYAAGRTAAAWKVRPTLLPQALYPDIWIAEQSLKQLDTMPSNRPWLLWVSFVGPHEPFDTPQPWHGRNQAQNLPAANPKPGWFNQLPEQCELRKTATSWAGKLSPDAIAACRADYADHLQLLDQQVSRLLGKLEQRSDEASTAIAVTSDHGEMLGDSEMLYKGTFLEGAIRVPWIYREPGRKGDHAKQSHKQNSLKPLPLTGLLTRTLTGLSTGGKQIALQRWASQQRGAVVEFGAERLLLQGAHKLALDENGQPLWAIHLGRDPQEQTNVIEEQPQRWRFSPTWRKLREWAKHETNLRSKPNWLWRQIEPQE